MQIIENINKYLVYPMRVRQLPLREGSSSRSHAFSAEPLALALIKIRRVKFLLKKSAANSEPQIWGKF